MILKYLVTGTTNEAVVQVQVNFSAMQRSDEDEAIAAAVVLENEKNPDNSPKYVFVGTESLDLVAIGPRGTKPHGATPF